MRAKYAPLSNHIGSSAFSYPASDFLDANNLQEEHALGSPYFNMQLLHHSACLWGLPHGSVGKNFPVVQETLEMWAQSLGWEDPLEEEMATHSSTLAWKIPWTEEPGRLLSMGFQRVRHSWATECMCLPLSFCEIQVMVADSCYTKLRVVFPCFHLGVLCLFLHFLFISLCEYDYLLRNIYCEWRNTLYV